MKVIKSGETKAAEQILGRLVEMYDKMNDAAQDYETLLESLISIFKNLEEVRFPEIRNNLYQTVLFV